MLAESNNIFNENFVDEVYEGLTQIEPFSTLSYEDLNKLKNVIWLYIDQLYNKKFIKSMDKVTDNVQNYINNVLRNKILDEYDEKINIYARQLSDNVMKYINDYYTAEEKAKYNIPNDILQKDKDNLLDYIDRVLNRVPGSISNSYFNRAIEKIKHNQNDSLINKINKFNDIYR